MTNLPIVISLDLKKVNDLVKERVKNKSIKMDKGVLAVSDWETSSVQEMLKHHSMFVPHPFFPQVLSLVPTPDQTIPEETMNSISINVLDASANIHHKTKPVGGQLVIGNFSALGGDFDGNVAVMGIAYKLPDRFVKQAKRRAKGKRRIVKPIGKKQRVGMFSFSYKGN